MSLSANGSASIAPRIPTGGEVLLFPDTFSNFFEPEIAIAATEVIERAGFRVVIPDRDVCCGRPLYEQGMIDEARPRMLDTTAALMPFVKRGVKIVGLEPSCILTFRDELPALFPRMADVRSLAANTLMFDEFLTHHAPDSMHAQIAGPRARARPLPSQGAGRNDE